MNKINTLKEAIYDDFICTADKCSLTCCNGWAIKVEEEDISKWKSNEDTHYLCEMIKKRKSDDGFDMKVTPKKGCLMLDECGLCEIVKKHGDEFLSKTCKDFPRKYNTVREYIDEETVGEALVEEYSLSGACPHVLELLYENEGKVIELDKLFETVDFPYEYKLRNFLIELITKKDLKLMDKCFIILSFLHECLECEWEEDVYNLMDTYREDENIKDIMISNAGNQIDKKVAFLELCQTFYDVTQYYKEEEMYRPYLFKLAEFMEGVEERLEELTKEWQTFILDYSKYDEYMTRIMTAEIFSDCISDDIGEIIENFQCILLEYLMTRLSVFANIKLGNEIELKKLQEYMALYIRMIGHNIEGVCEYWMENFEDSCLNLDYINLIIS